MIENKINKLNTSKQTFSGILEREERLLHAAAAADSVVRSTRPRLRLGCARSKSKNSAVEKPKLNAKGKLIRLENANKPKVETFGEN